MREVLYRILEIPFLYRLQEAILAPGAGRRILRAVEASAEGVPPRGLFLDVGCGPSSWLVPIGLHPVGLDLSQSYLQEFARAGERALAASATALPFPAQTFDGVWSVGLLHHLPDDAARRAVAEMVRVCKAGGRVVVFDAVLPRRAWRRPLAHLIRRLDRGRFMRSEAVLRQALTEGTDWRCRRVTYAATGLEALVCTLKLRAGDSSRTSS